MVSKTTPKTTEKNASERAAKVVKTPVATKSKPRTTKLEGLDKKKSKAKFIGLYRERCPEAHIIKGKFIFLYVLFAATMLVFACLTVWLFFFSTALLEKYEKIDICARAGDCRVITEDGEEIIIEEGAEE